MAGFFAGSTLAIVKAPQSRIPACGACGLYRLCTTPKMSVAGQGRKKILIVGEHPNKEADKRGTHFSKDDQQVLQKSLRKHGVDLHRDCWITTSLICRTEKDAKPTDKEIDHCRPNIINTITELKPVVVILLGAAATRSVIGWLWKAKSGEHHRWTGFKIPDREINAWVCPTYSMKEVIEAKTSVVQLLFDRHLKEAVQETAPPWEQEQDLDSLVDIIYDTEKAAKIIRSRLNYDKDTAFDYEANALKPDNPKHQLISCAICYGGKYTIAYPWQGQAIDATREYLRSPIPKRGANIKYEERWSRSKLNTRVRNWVWDTMIAAHIEDCRRGGVCSVKFQSYVKLGIGAYNDHIEEFLRTKKDSTINQISEEIGMRDLLKYNGIDAYVEYHIASIQMKRLKYKRNTR